MSGSDLDIKFPGNGNFCGGELKNVRLQLLSSSPNDANEARIWWDSVNHKPMYHDGTNSKEFGRVYSEGNGIDISSSNVISIDNSVTGATKCKITYDNNGLVTSGSDLAASDIPDISATYVATSLLGANSGVATLDSSGKVPSTQLPGFVDDVIDAYIVSGATALTSGWLSKTNGGSALTPETDKIYVVVSSGDYLNKTYRWSGSTYVEISASPGAATESAAGIIEIATQTETNTGTDDTRAITPLKLATYTSTMTRKITATNSAITVSDGVGVWTFANSLGTAEVDVSVYEVGSSANKRIYPHIEVSTSTITINVLSSSNISANELLAVVVG